MQLTDHVLSRLNMVFANPWFIILVSLTNYYPPPTFISIILNKHITGSTKMEHFSIVIPSLGPHPPASPFDAAATFNPHMIMTPQLLMRHIHPPLLLKFFPHTSHNIPKHSCHESATNPVQLVLMFLKVFPRIACYIPKHSCHECLIT